MASRFASSIAPIRPSSRTGRQLCASLAQQHRARAISESYLKKVAEGEERWAQRAERIQNGEEPHMWDILEERGFVKDVAGYARPANDIRGVYALTALQKRR